MAIFELIVCCPLCGRKSEILFDNNDSISTSKCIHCSGEAVKKIEGYVYVLHNRHMPGLVKIGYTTRLWKHRLDELNSPTGVPPSFEVIAVFVSDEPKADESKLHAALSTFRVERSEFFKIDSGSATKKCEDVLGRSPIHDRSAPYSKVASSAHEELCRVIRMDASMLPASSVLSGTRRYELAALADIVGVPNEGSHEEFKRKLLEMLIRMGVVR